MARFIALLLIGPWLAVLAWLYWLYVRRSHATPRQARADKLIVVAAFVMAIVGTLVGWEAAFGHAGPIWKQVAAALGAYAGFNLVLGLGLLRHWHHRTRDTAVLQRTSR